MEPPSEMVHWLFATGVLLLGLIMLAEAIVGRRGLGDAGRWRIYLWPGIAFGLGVLMWPVMTFFTNSAIHMVAHGAWAQALMAMGGGRARARARASCTAAGGSSRRRSALAVSGAAFLVHEQNAWFFARSAFLHHLVGWTLVGRRARPARRSSSGRARSCCRPASRSSVSRSSVMLFSDRDVAPVFGHLSPLAGAPHR